ncbi:hypothetical protein [Halobellus captivus]|uniref:hypothetical protein n=1 Tax=Halobellus captivus TaxID=2592614 RepID=UPI00119FC4FA|nr:hypothetical protein [Halobellus captivus]
MLDLNIFGCELQAKDLRIWRYPTKDNSTPQQLNERFDSFAVSFRTPPAVAYPLNQEGREKLDDEFLTGFEQRTVDPMEFLGPYANLCKYGFIRYLIDEHGWLPLQEDQTEVALNRVDRLFDPESRYSPVDGLDVHSGLQIRSQYWDLPGHGPYVGLVLNPRSTNHFTKPLDEVLDGVNETDYWLRMNCPSDCPHEDCTFHGETRAIGQFDAFTDGGEACRYSDSDDTPFVALADHLDGIDKNPPADRVAIEANYENIKEWTVDKHGNRYKNIARDIPRKAVDMPSHADRDKRAKYEHDQLREVVAEIGGEFPLPNGQTVEFDTDPIKLRGE